MKSNDMFHVLRATKLYEARFGRIVPGAKEALAAAIAGQEQLQRQEQLQQQERNLFDLGNDLNDQDENGRTALHHAAENGRNDVLSALLHNGADVLQDSMGLTALHMAARNGNVEAIRPLLQQNVEALLIESEPQRITYQIARGRTEQSFGFSALTEAILHGRENCVQELLEHYTSAPIHIRQLLTIVAQIGTIRAINEEFTLYDGEVRTLDAPMMDLIERRLNQLDPDALYQLDSDA
jgi:ankyrin repeat protein